MTEQQGVLPRRTFLGGSLGAGALTALSVSPARASSVHSYSATPLPSPREKHFLDRLTYGFSSGSLHAMREAGSPEAWLEGQLSPSTISESARAKDLDSYWSSLSLTPDQIVERDRSEVERGWEAMTNYVRWVMGKRIYSNRQVFERLVEVWEEHLYIPRNDDGVFPFRIDFGKKLRDLALTSFESLLLMSTLHPAMGVSLDNNRSSKKAINENLGRELLELHTVGQGNYTEADVKASAKFLTGYRVDTWSTWRVYYDPSYHYTGELTVKDFTHPNSDPDGRAACEAYLRYLANHPQTARRVCRKLALRFVSDNPSDQLLDLLAEVYLREATRIKPVLRALFSSEEFLSSAGKKVKSPTDELASLYRSLGVDLLAPTRPDSGINSFIWISSTLGQMPFDWPRPDGPPLTNDAWLNPSRFLASWEVHWGASGGWWPSKEVQWVSPAQRLPEASVSLGGLIDHLSRSLLGEEASTALLQAVSSATKTSLSTQVNKDHGIVRWHMASVLSLILNQPSFYRR